MESTTTYTISDYTDIEDDNITDTITEEPTVNVTEGYTSLLYTEYYNLTTDVAPRKGTFPTG
jgi:hypothetical protein